MTYSLLHTYETLCAWRACYRRPPTIGQLARACGKSTEMTRRELNALWRQGLVEWNGKHKRKVER